MTTALLESIPNTTTVAVSRLVDPDVWNELAAVRTVIEVPHIQCDPVPDTLTSPTLRLRCWPNIGGRLERGSSNDLVAWFPSLARRPDGGTVVPMTADRSDQITERIRFLDSLLKHLQQIRGVTGTCVPEAPRTILYTPGFDAARLSELNDLYPGSVAPSPLRLAEFPGGIRITITNDVWARDAAFTMDLTSLLGG